MDKPSIEAQDSARSARRRPRRLAASTALTVALSLLGGGVAKYEADQHAQNARDAALSAEFQQQRAINHRLGRLVAGLAGDAIRPETVEGTNLKKVADLPGHGQEVSQQTKEKLQAASVRLASRQAGASDNATWVESCSGTLVNAGPDMYVLTAGHCVTFSQRKGSLKGAIGKIPDVYNATTQLGAQYGLQVTDKAGALVGVQPISQVIYSTAADAALMRVENSGPLGEFISRSPALSAAELDAASGFPEPGSTAVLYSYPETAGGLQVAEQEIFLGVASDMYDESRTQVYVGINPRDQTRDACFYGASGSSAGLVGGRLTGPLSMRNNESYETGPQETQATPQQRTLNRLKIEQSLGIKLDEFSTICAFAAYPNVTQLLAGAHTAPPQMGYSK